jgi:hypothetical protein
MPLSARSSSCWPSASRSNKLMRLRVLVQFIAIIILVLLGVVAGAFRQ